MSAGDFPLSARLARYPALDGGRARVAIHEAGHVLVARLVGARPTRVELAADRHSGQAWHSRADDEGELVVFRAGLAAELEFGHSEGLWWDCSRPDREQANAIAARLEPIYPERAIARANALAHELLFRHWPAVERLGELLLTEGALEGADLLACVDAALAGAVDIRATAVPAQLERERAERAAFDHLVLRRRRLEELVAARDRSAPPTDDEFAALWSLADDAARAGLSLAEGKEPLP